MEIVENLTKTTLQEIEKILTTRTIVGEPMTLDGRTLVPLISIGFGFGAGGGLGKGEGQRKGEGEGGGTGGGAWIRPIAVVISDKDGVRVEPVIGGLSAALEKVGESIPKLVEKIVEKLTERKKEG
jgi:uncharacterized spore protein YtfJ